MRAARGIAIDRLFADSKKRYNHRNEAIYHVDPNNSEPEESSDEELEHDVDNVDENYDVSESDISEDEIEPEAQINSQENDWKKRDFNQIPTQYDFNPPQTENVGTPYEYFKRFLTDNMLQNISDQTNTYYFQQNNPKTLSTTPKEIEMVIGILFKMGIVKMSNIRDYWANSTYYHPIASVMSRNRFQVLMRHIHFIDNTDENVDKTNRLWKILPFLNPLRENFLNVTPEEHHAVDEMSIAYKGTRGPRQYNPKKPKKWHFTVYCRAGSSGYIYDFEVFSGAHPQPPSSAGVSGDIVIRLTATLPDNVPFKIFADNWFVSYQLVQTLQIRGFHFTGTFRSTRIKMSLQTEKQLKDSGRGSCDYLVNLDGTVIAVKWFDNRSVHLISTYSGTEPMGEIKRYDRKEKKFIMVPCPAIISEYNKFMGGIDLMDSLVALFKYVFKSARYYMYIWHHMLHVTLVNAWLLYRRDCKMLNTDVMPLKEFQLDVADSLIKINCPVGRPSLLRQLIPQRRNKRRSTSPVTMVRADDVGHFPIYHDKRSRCSVCQSNSIFTHWKCCKCQTYLCLTKDKNCFWEFHHH